MASRSAGSELDELSRNSYQQELDRSLHPLRSLIMGVASCGPIGSVFAYVPALLFICGMFSWYAMVIAAVLCIFQGLAYAEVGSAYPVAGGEYSMVARVLGKALGIITFGLMSAMYIFVPTAASLAAGGILGVIWPWAGAHTHVIAVLVIVYAASVSFLKVKLGTWVAAFFVAVQIVALLVVTVLGLVHWHSPAERLFSTQALDANGNMTTVVLAAAVVGITVSFFIYQGFGNVIIFSEETKKAKAKIGGAAMGATITAVVVILVPTTALLLGAPSVNMLLTSASPLADTIAAWGGNFFGKVISFIIFLAILDLATASMMAFARVYWSGGRDNVWPTPISKALAVREPEAQDPVGRGHRVRADLRGVRRHLERRLDRDVHRRHHAELRGSHGALRHRHPAEEEPAGAVQDAALADPAGAARHRLRGDGHAAGEEGPLDHADHRRRVPGLLPRVPAAAAGALEAPRPDRRGRGHELSGKRARRTRPRLSRRDRLTADEA